MTQPAGRVSGESALFCTDFVPAYHTVIPDEPRAAAGKNVGLHNYVEQFWLTVRQGVGRDVDKTLLFSKCW